MHFGLTNVCIDMITYIQYFVSMDFEGILNHLGTTPGVQAPCRRTEVISGLNTLIV